MMRDIFASDRLDERFTQLLEDGDPRLRLYVYRLDAAGRKIRPALLVGRPTPDLCEHLRLAHGGGAFAVMIRRGAMMELSGVIRIGVPHQHLA
ncbi:MAG: hypothetical protein D6807_00160 [Alphaproteobacteria bacterium]|nr:MAG: hypothetical protein D6807_00160 [Alphaproteobacteria bacterium]